MLMTDGAGETIHLRSDVVHVNGAAPGAVHTAHPVLKSFSVTLRRVSASVTAWEHHMAGVAVTQSGRDGLIGANEEGRLTTGTVISYSAAPGAWPT